MEIFSLRQEIDWIENMLYLWRGDGNFILL